MSMMINSILEIRYVTNLISKICTYKSGKLMRNRETIGGGGDVFVFNQVGYESS